MKKVRQEGTSAEKAVWEIADDIGLEYERNSKGLPGTPDLVHREHKWAVFVHGCFWHAHEDCSRSSLPKTNTSLWRDKFKRNIERDSKNIALLKEMGFHVAVIWECQISNSDYVMKTLNELKS